jgi:hypothetical protein
MKLFHERRRRKKMRKNRTIKDIVGIASGTVHVSLSMLL